MKNKIFQKKKKMKKKRNESWNNWVLKYLFQRKSWIVVVGSWELQTNKQKDSKFSNSLLDKVKLDFGSKNGDAKTENIYLKKMEQWPFLSSRWLKNEVVDCNVKKEKRKKSF